MVQDARVNHHLTRLGGVYRDPARVNRDASTLLKASVGNHLQPITAVYADVGTTNGNSRSSTVLVLQGTIAIHFKGITYQLLIDMYLVPDYPIRPPVCFVRLADSSMYLKQNHKHVGSDGKVYLPYLSEWSSSSHNLVELVVAMSSVFSAEPPVFSRPTQPPPVAVAMPLTTTQHPPNSPIRNGRVAYSTSMNGTSSVSFPQARATTIGGNSINSNDMMTLNERQQLEEMLARDAAEANVAIEAARRAELEERRREEALQIQRQWEDAKLFEIRSDAQQKVRQHVAQIANKVQTNVRQDWKDSELLNLSANNKIDYQCQLFTKVRDKLMSQTSTVSEKLKDIELWLEEEKKKNHPTTTTQPNTVTKETINTIVATSNPIDQQMLDLACENASYQDVLYNLDRLLLSGCIDCTTHLKYIRKVAKDQFYSRALLIKIQQKRQQLQFQKQHHKNHQQQPW